MLCGGATHHVHEGLRSRSTEAGYQPEVAYYECLHELKLIVDLLHEGGLAKMHQYISHTAKWGDLTRGPRVVNAGTKKEMKKILKEVQDGQVRAAVDPREQDRPPQVRRADAEGSRAPDREGGQGLRCAPACPGWKRRPLTLPAERGEPR